MVLTWEREAERGTGIWGETVIWGVRGDGDLGGGEGDLGGGREGDLGVMERGIWGEMGIWVVETVMWRVVERGRWGGG